MLLLTAAAADPLTIDVDILAVPVFKGGIEGPGAGPVLAALGLADFPVTPDFRGDIGQTLLLAAPGLTARGVLLVGLGRMDAIDDERMRQAAGFAARAAQGAQSVATTLAEVHPTTAAIGAIAEGFHLGGYSDRRFKAEGAADAPRLETVTILTPTSRLADAQGALERAEIRARATTVTRDLVNLPPDRKRPADLVELVRGVVGDRIEVLVRDPAALEAQGFGGLLGVGRGSDHPPYLVELRYRPKDPLGHVALVGKGITFDSGGLSLKRGTNMEQMKSDMAGAAAITAICSVLGELDVRLQVTGILCLAENMPGGDAQRPGDVIRHYGGTTSEVLDTDAEGRLVLADGLAYASSLGPDAIVDLATLTGACITALGIYSVGLMANDDELAEDLLAAARAAGEPFWRLPLWEHLDRFLDSPVADVANIADDPGAGAIVAGLFLQRFVGDVPWAHLDLAGAFLERDESRHYLTTGATGIAVRSLLAWLGA